MAAAVSTPMNTISRENLPVLIRNNTLNDSLEFMSDCDTSMMETDSPLRKPDHRPISKKLFHSPLAEPSSTESYLFKSKAEITQKKAKKRKQSLIPDAAENIKRVYVKECEGDGYSPDMCGGMRKKVLISLFHNKEYSMDFS